MGCKQQETSLIDVSIASGSFRLNESSAFIVLQEPDIFCKALLVSGIGIAFTGHGFRNRSNELSGEWTIVVFHVFGDRTKDGQSASVVSQVSKSRPGAPGLDAVCNICDE
jgi:hypothetical protein